jgi:hypothetical protein
MWTVVSGIPAGERPVARSYGGTKPQRKNHRPQGGGVGSVPNPDGGGGVPDETDEGGGFSKERIVSSGFGAAATGAGRGLGRAGRFGCATTAFALGAVLRFDASGFGAGFGVVRFELPRAPAFDLADFPAATTATRSARFNALNFLRASFASFFACLKALRVRRRSSLADSASRRIAPACSRAEDTSRVSREVLLSGAARSLFCGRFFISGAGELRGRTNGTQTGDFKRRTSVTT